MGAYVYRLRKNAAFKTVQGDAIHKSTFQGKDYLINHNIRPVGLTENVLFMVDEDPKAGTHVYLYNHKVDEDGIFIDDTMCDNKAISFVGFLVPHKKRFILEAGSRPKQMLAKAFDMMSGRNCEGSLGLTRHAYARYNIENGVIHINISDKKEYLFNTNELSEYPTSDEYMAMARKIAAALDTMENFVVEEDKMRF